MKTKLLLSLGFIYLGIVAAQEKNLYDTEIYRNRIAQFKSEIFEKHQIIFLGNSLTQGGKWEQYFPNKKITNRGISGDNTDGILARLDGIIEAQPEKIFILSGINDVSQNYNNDYICNNMRQIIQRIKAELPETTIYFQSILPINNNFGHYKRLINKEKQIEQLNKQISKLCKAENIQFINLYPSFLIKKRLLDPRYTVDGLHLNETGYEIWVDKIRKFVEE